MKGKSFCGKIVKCFVVGVVSMLFLLVAFSCKTKLPSLQLMLSKAGTFRILQLTDLHFLNSTVISSKIVENYSLRDEWTMTCVDALVKETEPDMIVVTGDAIFTLNSIAALGMTTNDNYAAFQKFAKFIDSFKKPWAFVFGNHDEEGMLKDALGSGTEAKKALGEYLTSDEIKYCMYKDGDENLNGVGNYVLNVKNRNGSVNTSLVMLDSGSFLKGDQRKYDCVHDDQLDWYESEIKKISAKAGLKEGEVVPSLMFVHIPFPEYLTALNKFTAGCQNWQNVMESGTPTTVIDADDGAITYHGGIYNEGEVCHSFVGTFKGVKYDGGHTFERILALGSTKGVFCGHDHRNTYSLTYKGVRLTYGMSVDYSANGLLGAFADNQDIYDETVQRGGTLITISEDSSFTVEQVPFTRNLYREALAA